MNLIDKVEMTVRDAAATMISDKDILINGSTDYDALSVSVFNLDKAMEDGTSIPPVIAEIGKLRGDENKTYRLAFWRNKALSTLSRLADANAKIENLKTELESERGRTNDWKVMAKAAAEGTVCSTYAGETD